MVDVLGKLIRCFSVKILNLKPHLNPNLRIYTGVDMEKHISHGSAKKQLNSRKERIFATRPKTAKKILDFGDNFAWWDLGKSYCKSEGKAMGHHGNTIAPKPYQTILSLREEHKLDGKSYYEPHLTFILDKKGGLLGEMKGKANEKPAPKYHYYIKELLKQPFIKMIEGGGYAPENNFSFSDLQPDHQREVLEANPSLIYDTKSKDNLVKILTMLPKDYIYDFFRYYAAQEADLSKIDIMVLESLIDLDGVYNKMASNPTLPHRLMERLADHKDTLVRSNLAINPSLPSYLVEKLARDKQASVRSIIAKRNDLTPKAMEILSNDNHICVVADLALNPSLPSSLVEKLASHEDWFVRCSVAKRPDLSIRLMEMLSNDSKVWVLSDLALNPNLPSYLVEKLASNEDWSVRCEVAKRQDLSIKSMEILSNDENVKVILRLASNSKLPDYLIEKIAVRASNFDAYKRVIYATLVSHQDIPVHLIEHLKKAMKTCWFAVT